VAANFNLFTTDVKTCFIFNLAFCAGIWMF